MSSRRPSTLLPAIAAAVVLSACAGPSVLVVGESVRQPEPAPPMVEVVVTASDDLMPLSGARVEIGDEVEATDLEGLAGGVWQGQPVTVEVTAPGFVTSTVAVVELPEEPIEVKLAPVELRGHVKGPDGRPLPLTTVTMGGVVTTTDESGTFVVTRAVPGAIEAHRPAWHDAAAEWNGTAPTVELVLEPRMIRALRVGGDAAGDPDHWAEILALAESSSINALVVDTKDEAGIVMWATEVPEAIEIGAVQRQFDVDQVIADMEEHDLYKITRVVTFQDSFMARANPELAATDSETATPWQNFNGEMWLDASDRDAWEYPLALAVDACNRGFDEIQFDYVRFPSDGPVGRLALDGDYTPEARVETIASFLSEARSRLHPLGCAVSADIFAIVVSVGNDQGIGQRPEELSQSVDVISPMIYPSHYGANWLGFANPNDYPREVVGEALDSGLPRLLGPAIMRPWLQTYPYGRTEIEIEINEAEDRNLGWMLWSAGTQFSRSWLPNDPLAEAAER